MKKILKVLPIVLAVCLIFTSIYAVDRPGNNILNQGKVDTNIQKKAVGVWKTIASVIQVLAIAAVVFAGLRYMFSSADAKADIKKSMGILAIGAMLIFGATWILQIIYDATNSTIGTTVVK